MPFNDPYNRHLREIDKETEKDRIRKTIINEYPTSNRIMKSIRLLEYLGDDHRYLRSIGIDMNIINHYRTPNNDLVYDRYKEYLKYTGGRGSKNYNVNKIKFFRDIPDGVEILIDYVDVIAIRTMNIPREIIYESIYMELPELFEE